MAYQILYLYTSSSLQENVLREALPIAETAKLKIAEYI
jgi:hypothetical protein